MSRKFKHVDYDQMVHVCVRVGDCVPPGHLARFVVEVLGVLDLSAFYARYGSRGAPPYAPELVLGLLLYGYITGVLSSRRIEQATKESLPFIYLSGGWHPDHDTLASFRTVFLAEIRALFVQVLLVAQEAGVLKLGRISLDGSKVHADASKSQAVSYRRLVELEAQLNTEVEQLLALAGQADQGEPLQVNFAIEEEVRYRQARLASLAEAKAVLVARAEERYAHEQALYEAKCQEREARARAEGRKPRGRAPVAPTPGPRPGDQYNFTDPDSRIMKNSTNQGFEQHYNAQVAVDQTSRLIVGYSLSNHPNDQAEARPTMAAIPPALGKPEAAALDCGYFSAANIEYFEHLGIEPYIATGRNPHHISWQQRFAQQPTPPAEDATPKVKMAYKLQTQIGQAIYGLRKSTVEPVIGIIKETWGFRQFSLRGLPAVTGEWALVCLAFNFKRLHTLTNGQLPQTISPTGC